MHTTDRQQLSQRSIQHQFSHLHDGRLKTQTYPTAAVGKLFFTERGKAIDAGKSCRQRLFDQHVNTSVRAKCSDLDVRSGRSCDHRGIEPLERNGSDVGEPIHTSVSVCDLNRTLFARVCEGDGGSVDLTQGANVPLADRSGANDENPYRRRVLHSTFSTLFRRFRRASAAKLRLAFKANYDQGSSNAQPLTWGA